MTIRTSGSPKTPRTLSLARKPANEYPSDSRRRRLPDFAIPHDAEFQRRSKPPKAHVHRTLHGFNPPKSPTRFPEDPEFATRDFAQRPVLCADPELASHEAHRRRSVATAARINETSADRVALRGARSDRRFFREQDSRDHRIVPRENSPLPLPLRERLG